MSSGPLRLALKKLSHRNWSQLKEEWVSYIPTLDFDRLYPEPTLWQIGHFSGSFAGMADGAVIESIGGVREALFREAAILARKFSHCRSVILLTAAEGRATWAAVSAYEACFYGAKAFCYLLGFASVGRNSSFYLDAFFEVSVRRGRGLTEERYDMKLHKLPERLTHAILWGLTSRLVDTTSFEDDLAELKTELRRIDWDDFSNLRNSLMYDGAFWTKLDDYEECDLINFVSDISIYRTSRRQAAADSTPFAKEYFRAVELFGSALSLMFSDLARLSPTVAAEATAIQNPYHGFGPAFLP